MLIENKGAIREGDGKNQGEGEKEKESAKRIDWSLSPIVNPRHYSRSNIPHATSVYSHTWPTNFIFSLSLSHSLLLPRVDDVKKSMQIFFFFFLLESLYSLCESCGWGFLSLLILFHHHVDASLREMNP